MDVSLRRILFGTDEPLPETLELQAGPLSLRLRGTRLLGVYAGGCEVWHGVAFLHRDVDWGTAEPVLDRIEQTVAHSGFSVRVTAHVPVEPVIDLVIEVDGSADGRVRYAGSAVPRGDIDTNRTGLCLMHPLAAAGRRIELGHADRRISGSTFPSLIAPWPPFTGVRSIRHEYAAGAWAEAVFEGDVFEFEDQRNNADASYKSYNRSNMMPRPYRLRAGEAIRQSVQLRLLQTVPDGGRSAVDRELSSVPTRGRASLAFPQLALAVEAFPDRVGLVGPALERLAPALLHLTLDDPAQPADWPMLARLLAAADARLRVDVAGLTPSGAAGALASLADAMTGAGICPASLAVFPSTPPIVAAARAAFAHSAIGGGTPYFFTQLNRAEDLGALDFLTFCTGALVHGADDESVMLGLASLPSMLETLAVMRPGLPVEVGPSAIGSRHSPLGRQPASDGTCRLALARHDPRSRALFGAAWLVGHVAQLASAGARTISLLSLAGPGGLLQVDGAGVRPCPAFFVFECLREARSLVAVGLSACGRWASIRFGTGNAELQLIAHLGTDADCELPTAVAQPADRAPQLMDAAAWRDFVDGRSGSPWRELDGLAACRLPPCGVMLLRR